MFKLCGENAFESQPRVKNLIYHVRGEMRNALDEFKVLCNHQIVNIPYSSGSCLPSYDVYFVKIFEGFCDLWAVSYEDHRAFETYYFATKMRAQLHIRLMDQLGELLKKQFSNEMI
ncbi:MAG: hypothetical protein JWR69_747 [Pedosphaera sp.]|nr:hypothetical protein [Pedosphaera sp.]